jgi:hypothetical protein
VGSSAFFFMEKSMLTQTLLRVPRSAGGSKRGRTPRDEPGSCERAMLAGFCTRHR